MKKSKFKKNEPKKISLEVFGRIFAWIFAVILIIGTIDAFITSRFVYGTILLVMGLIALPFFDTLLKNYAKIELSGGIKAVIIICGFILLGILSVGQQPTRTNTQGSSLQTAIIVAANNEKEGVAREYKYLNANACKEDGVREVLGQSLEKQDEHMYDILLVNCYDGSKEIYYFNIDSFFGKV